MFSKQKLMLAIAITFCFFACSLGRTYAPPDKLGEDINSHPVVMPDQTGVDARSRAASELLFRACKLIEEKRLDDAIDTLERAITLDPKEGQNYYHLAWVWMKKGNVAQALEFNSLAEIYLSYDAEWAQRVAEQKISIQEIQ